MVKVKHITPFLWFHGQAEAAAQFYTSLFADSKITDIRRYPEGGPMPAGEVLTVSFELNGQQFIALNGEPLFKFSEAISFFVIVETQAEVDELWVKLTADGGEEGPCGWLKDKYGLSWQIVPAALEQLLSDPDPTKASRAMQAMMGMKKIDIAGLQRAHDGQNEA